MPDVPEKNETKTTQSRNSYLLWRKCLLKVENFFGKEGNSWHLMCSPVSSPQLKNWELTLRDPVGILFTIFLLNAILVASHIRVTKTLWSKFETILSGHVVVVTDWEGGLGHFVEQQLPFSPTIIPCTTTMFTIPWYHVRPSLSEDNAALWRALQDCFLPTWVVHSGGGVENSGEDGHGKGRGGEQDMARGGGEPHEKRPFGTFSAFKSLWD